MIQPSQVRYRQGLVSFGKGGGSGNSPSYPIRVLNHISPDQYAFGPENSKTGTCRRFWVDLRSCYQIWWQRKGLLLTNRYWATPGITSRPLGWGNRPSDNAPVVIHSANNLRCGFSSSEFSIPHPAPGRRVVVSFSVSSYSIDPPSRVTPESCDR